jgi:hypothetical protein
MRVTRLTVIVAAMAVALTCGACASQTTQPTRTGMTSTSAGVSTPVKSTASMPTSSAPVIRRPGRPATDPQRSVATSSLAGSSRRHGQKVQPESYARAVLSAAPVPHATSQAARRQVESPQTIVSALGQAPGTSDHLPSEAVRAVHALEAHLRSRINVASARIVSLSGVPSWVLTNGRNLVCLLTASMLGSRIGVSYGITCQSIAGVRLGRLMTTVSDVPGGKSGVDIRGIVPDGVRSLVVAMTGGGRRQIPVRANYYATEVASPVSIAFALKDHTQTIAVPTAPAKEP